MKHRHRMEILADILVAARNGARKTRIMQEANLSHDLLNKYLTEAVDNAFLQSNNFGFELTEKGQRFLEQYDQLYEEFSKIGNSLRTLKSKWQAIEQMCQERSKNKRRTHATEEDRTFRKELFEFGYDA